MKEIITDGLRFLCDTDIEVWRAQTLLTKEPGTIAWLNATLREADVFYDVGANIGAYTLYAARLLRRLGPYGAVYAFEPHIANATNLLRNIAANDLGHRVQVVTSALHNELSYVPFYYRELQAGSSGSQLGHLRGEDGESFSMAAKELKHAATAAWLITEGIAINPDVVKIDVDGNELAILQGLFLGWEGNWPRSIQVEIHAVDRAAIQDLCARSGYTQTGEHFTKQGQQAVERGADPATITNNAIFSRAA